ncbi:MAG: FTR1 family iron permease [Candidatus Thorarchaeota archaeon]|jgi:high-affinity iron transporter
MIIAPLVISLREGIEAALVIAVMLSYLRKTNRDDLRRFVLGGAGVALIASVGVALVMGLVWGILEGPILATFEGVVVLIAALLLTTMILWMWKAGPNVSSEIEGSVERRSLSQSGIGVALLAFALVMREGVELVLFSMALVIQDGLEVYLGVTLGLLIAVVLGLGIYQGSLRISLRSFFKYTSAFLILVAAGMVAYGIHELQEAGLLLIGPIEVWNINPPVLPDGSYPLLHDKGLIGGLLKAMFGYNGNPSFLEVTGYALYLLILAGYYAYQQRNQPASTAINDHEETPASVTA